MMDLYKSRNCRICTKLSDVEKVGIVSNQYQLVRCAGCGTVLAETLQARVHLSAVYDDLFSNDVVYKMHRDDYETVLSGRLPFSWRRTIIMNRVKKMTQGRDMVEIGGGTGVFGYSALKSGWNYQGYDISSVAVEFARKLSLRVSLFDANMAPPIDPASCDVIVMWEVVEHVWQLGKYLKTIRNGLRPNGVFVFSTPNFANINYQKNISKGLQASSPPVHVNFFSSESIKKVLYTNGFEHVSLYMPRLKIPSKKYKSISNLIKTVLFLNAPETIFGVARV